MIVPADCPPSSTGEANSATQLHPSLAIEPVRARGPRPRAPASPPDPAGDRRGGGGVIVGGGRLGRVARGDAGASSPGWAAQPSSACGRPMAGTSCTGRVISSIGSGPPRPGRPRQRPIRACSKHAPAAASRRSRPCPARPRPTAAGRAGASRVRRGPPGWPVLAKSVPLRGGLRVLLLGDHAAARPATSCTSPRPGRSAFGGSSASRSPSSWYGAGPRASSSRTRSRQPATSSP